MTRGEDVTMTDVKAKSPSFSRRKLSAVVRKAITSYYTAEEQQEIAQAAKREGISMSSFMAVRHCSFANSALACFRMGISGSASFHRAKNSW